MLRLQGVILEGLERNFFNHLEHVIDFGSGPGTFDIAALASQLSYLSYTFIESRHEAIEWHKKIMTRNFSLTSAEMSLRKWLPSFIPSQKIDFAKSDTSRLSHSLLVFSYSLNEIGELPSWAYDFEALMIVEPSHQKDGRALQALRDQLIRKGFLIWAPCTHQLACPLQIHSKTDWCHQRINVELSPDLKKIEQYLPIKNQTLTYSYLLARKTPAPVISQARIIGDTLFEKGKVKQAVCRKDQREFLTWLTRNGEPEPLPRGALFQIPENAEIKGSEIRITN